MNRIQKEIKAFIRYWTFPVLRPRRFHAFGIGMPKTGTHSLDAVFRNYRTWHEPEIVYFMRIVMDHAEGKLPEDRYRERIRHMDRRLWLEFNSSHVNYFLLQALVEEMPDTKFVLTIRDCYSWLDSLVNQLLAREHGEFQRQFHSWYAESLTQSGHQQGDQAFRERGLWPLPNWLHAWSAHNNRVLDLVPAERLLIVRTHEIRTDIARIADFLGIDPQSLDASRSHEFHAAKKFGLLEALDERYLESCVEQYCRTLMTRFFPEIRSLGDIPGYRAQDRAGIAAPGNSAELANSAKPAN